MALLYAIITVVGWGTWLVPSQNVKFSGQQVRAFYTTVANLLISGAIGLSQGLESLDAGAFWWPFSGGIVWALGGWTAFTAAEKIGLVRAYGIWSPLNIVVSLVLGALFFHEFVALDARSLAILGGAVAFIIAGVLMIIFSRDDRSAQASKRSLWVGVGCAVAAGVFWAAYYIPIRVSKASMWVAAFPMGCGMCAGCLALVLVSRQSLKLENGSAYLRTAFSGALWASGNYGMLLLVQALGTARGFTIAQLALVMNALCGIYVLKEPAPGSRAARLALTGCVLATVGAIALGRLR